MGNLSQLEALCAAVLRDRLAKATNPRKDPHYKAVHAIADAQVKRWARDFLEAVRQTRDAILIPEIQKAIASGDSAAVEQAIPWTKFEEVLLGSWQQRLRDIVAQAAEASVALLEKPADIEVVSIPPTDLPPLPTGAPPAPPSSGKVKLRFNLLNVKAVKAVEGYAGDLVKEVSRETQLTIRGIIQEAFLEGNPPAKTARKIRDNIGLLERHAAAADKYRDRQAKAIAAKNPNLSSREVAAKADAQAERYRGKLLNYRAESIARTETMAGSNLGQELLWAQAEEQGLLDPGRMMRKWVITPDDRLCRNCNQMRGERAYAEMGEPFDTPLGQVLTPPMHPHCRCTVILVRRPKE